MGIVVAVHIITLVFQLKIWERVCIHVRRVCKVTYRTYMYQSTDSQALSLQQITASDLCLVLTSHSFV